MKADITGNETWNELHSKLKSVIEGLEDELKQKNLTIAALSHRPRTSPLDRAGKLRQLLAAAALQSKDGELVIDRQSFDLVDLSSNDAVLWTDEKRSALVVGYHKRNAASIPEATVL